ncbi:hypothetical protein F8M41_012709 [Gigaspora margarita]|uniref:Uncharacterized protein n=1 Tax=Gigaspora margarita TaxID=4874 RepID=A0A8H4ASY1_GIGMA|nr:hypothetical protein F8M41_012709 [Gigaspora margarita]
MSFVDIITSAQNNKVTNDATKLAEIEEIVDLDSYIKVPTQVICSEKSCLLTITRTIKLYHVPGSLEENDSTNLIAEEEVLEEKNAESDPGVVLENIIDDYLEVIKGWSSGPK